MERAVKLFLIIFLVLSTTQIISQDSWETEVENMLHEFMQCNPSMPTSYPCNVFTSRALERIFGIEDFKSGNKHLSANQIHEFVSTKPDIWTKLGNASDQNALLEAQGYANIGKAVLAVLKNSSGSGHVAIIIPGELSNSSDWSLKVPNSASFFLNKPEKSYVGKKLSYAFSKKNLSKIEIYGRNY